MIITPYSYNECLAIIDLCSGLELHIRSLPEAHHIRVLGIGLTHKILEMSHSERIAMIKDVVQFL